MWCLPRIDPERVSAWLEDLNAPALRRPRQPDRVPQTVIDEEMDLFMQAQGVLR